MARGRPVSVQRIPRSQHRFSFSGDGEPALQIAPGSTVVVETLDCFSNRVRTPDQVFERERDLLCLIGAYNPVNAPIFVEGAEPGDALAVHIEHMALGTLEPFGVMVVAGDDARICGRPSPFPLAADTRVCRLEGRTVVVPARQGALRQPLRPMIGVIGTAPAAETISSLHYGPTHGGNMDCAMISEGATVRLPVNVPGGLLSLGDLHALMGDGEIVGVAVETHGDVTIRVDVVKGAGRGAAVRVDTRDAIGSIGCEAQTSLDQNLAAAAADLLSRLCGQWEMAPVEAYELLGMAARMTVNQCVHGRGSGWTSALVSLSRSALPDGVVA